MLLLSLAGELDAPTVSELIDARLPDFLSAETGDVAESFRTFLLESGTLHPLHPLHP